ncbi:hypothetical protein Pmar_PMAR017358, partial [Perkinsus marinus ATCC 50983]
TTTSSAGWSHHIRDFGLPPPSKSDHPQCDASDWSPGTVEWEYSVGRPTSDLNAIPATAELARFTVDSAESISLENLRVALQASHRRMMTIVEEERTSSQYHKVSSGSSVNKDLCQELVEGSEGYARLRQWAERSGF